MTVTAGLTAALLWGGAPLAPAWGQPAIPPNLTQLRPIKGIAYDPKPSDFPQDAYFDSDFFNGDFTPIWGDDGQPGSRRDLDTFRDAGLNFLHLYNWNAQRVNHVEFLDAARARGITVMVPVSNFTAGTIVGVTPGCDTCPHGYVAALDLVRGIFDQVYRGGITPHPAVAMWGIFNEYDLNKIDPVNVAFVVQAILTLEGRWVVRCLKPSDDCPTFTVTFGAGGGISAHDLWGSQSPHKGGGSIANGVLDIDIGGIFSFTGTLEQGPSSADGKGRLVARGILRDLDFDGDRFESLATATRLCCDRLTGTAHGVGRGPRRAGIGIVGTFLVARPIDLRTAKLSLTKLLDDGTGDVSGLALVADPRNSATTAYFRTPPGATPTATVSIRDRGRGEFAFRIDVSQATAGPSAQCPGPRLSTAFVIDGLTVSQQQPWLCFGTGDQYLNARP